MALVITGDNVGAHKWKETSQALKDILEQGGRIKVDITTTPSKDLTPENLNRYNVLILNYWNSPNGPPETRWSDANKEAFLKAVADGKGLVSYHFGSAAFARPNWVEFEKAVAGGWRTVGFHGPAHVFRVKKTNVKHPISEVLPAQFEHPTDELYQNSMLTPGSEVLATAYSDPAKPRGHGQGRAGDLGEPLWEGSRLRERSRPRHHRDGRSQLPGLAAPGCHLGGDRQGGMSGEPRGGDPSRTA